MNQTDYEKAIDASIATCKNCRLNDNYHLPVPGMWVGPRKERPDLFILAEAPGREESDPTSFPPDTKFGKPLVGPAGQALSLMMIDTGYQANKMSMYLTNTVKHRPPNNRPPQPDEKASCRTYLIAQLRIYRPHTILALGKHASEELRIIGNLSPLGEKESHYRKDFLFRIPHVTEDTKVFCTYHPSYACLRRPEMKPTLEGDLKEVLEWLIRRP